MRLKRIADDLMREAIAKREAVGVSRIVEKHLGGGVRLRLCANNFEFSLLVIRPNILPGDVEMKVFRNVFECPEDTSMKAGGGPAAGFYYWLVWQIPIKL